MEYALWIPLALLGLAAVRTASRRTLPRAPSIVVIGAVVAHAAYYTLVIGGDHFEYRVYVHLLPLACVTTAWASARLELKPGRAIALALAFLGASLPIPWVHWAQSRRLTTRPETHVMFVPVAPAFPPPLAWVVRPFDDAQQWLIEHHVCMRHQEHRVFWKKLERNCPSRAEGSSIPPEGLPVLAVGNVGVVGWVFPHVNIIDTGGLNDRVIARTPARRDRMRRMAHDRQPPAGYVESFRPNFDFEGTVYPPDGNRVLAEVGRYRLIERRIPLTEGEVRAQEALWKNKIETIRRIVERSGNVY
jgi:arabinofuranosyltransferase